MENNVHARINDYYLKLTVSAYLYKYRRKFLRLIQKIYFRFSKKRRVNQQGNNEKKYSIAWVVSNHLIKPIISFSQLQEAIGMRVSQIAEWINRHSKDCHCEMYHPERKYHAVIFFKAMDALDQTEAHKIKGYGGKVIFDANVNYYEQKGKFGSFSNRPTIQQKRDAIEMTRLADLCIADSNAILKRVEKYNGKAVCIPDNVNPSLFKYTRRHSAVKPVRLVWSGISFKADHLVFLKDVFSEIENAELILVAEKKPTVIHLLEKSIKCRYLPYSDEGYARILGHCDIIISPKMLMNSYEIGHTEYKISLGMAVGLPAVASPQQSYIEIINHKGGGIIAETSEEWIDALNLLIRDHRLRANLGKKASETILEKYATSIIAGKYYREISKCVEV